MLLLLTPHLEDEIRREYSPFQLRGVEMRSKDKRKVQRINEKISHLSMEREKIRKSARDSKSLSKVCRLMIFRVFGWKISITKYEQPRVPTAKILSYPQSKSLSQKDG